MMDDEFMAFYATFYANWPDCVIDGCPNKCCLSLNSIYCFLHTPGNKYVKNMKIDAKNMNYEKEKVKS